MIRQMPFFTLTDTKERSEKPSSEQRRDKSKRNYNIDTCFCKGLIL